MLGSPWHGDLHPKQSRHWLVSADLTLFLFHKSRMMGAGLLKLEAFSRDMHIGSRYNLFALLEFGDNPGTRSYNCAWAGTLLPTPNGEGRGKGGLKIRCHLKILVFKQDTHSCVRTTKINIWNMECANTTNRRSSKIQH